MFLKINNTLAITTLSILFCDTQYSMKLCHQILTISRLTTFFNTLFQMCQLFKKSNASNQKGQSENKGEMEWSPLQLVLQPWPLTSGSSRCEVRLWMSLLFGASLGNCALPSMLALQGHRWSYTRGRIQVQQDCPVACHMMHSVVYAKVQCNEIQIWLVTVASIWIWLVIEVQSMTQAIHSLLPVDIQHEPII